MLQILLVEDDADTTILIRGILTQDGHSVVICAVVDDGMRAAGAGEFDIIILDRMLPDMNGLEIFANQRGAGVVTPTLMLSTLALSENRTEGITQGAD